MKRACDDGCTNGKDSKAACVRTERGAALCAPVLTGAWVYVCCSTEDARAAPLRGARDDESEEDDHGGIMAPSPHSKSETHRRAVVRAKDEPSGSSRKRATERRNAPRKEEPSPSEIIVLDDSDEEMDVAPRASTPSGPKKAPDAWECPMCTYLNETNGDQCEICDSPAPSATSTSSSRPQRKLTQWLAPVAATIGKASAPSSKSAADRKKRKNNGTGPVETIDSSGDSGVEGNSSEGRSKRNRPSAVSASRSSPSSNALWTDTHTPHSVDELCVNKKKIQELSDWMHRNATPQSVHVPISKQRILFLCGPPGSGKSTSVRCIASQMGISVSEWNDNASAGKLSYERMLRDEFWTPQRSGVDDFMEFITRSVTYAALPLATTAASSGSKRRRVRKRKLLSSQPLNAGGAAFSSQVILIENWPQAWSSQSFGSSPSSSWENENTSNSIQSIFKHIVDPTTPSRFPIVCIFSDIKENKIDMNHLTKLFSPDVIQSPFTSVINFNAVTSAQLKKQLTRIADVERCNLTSADLQHVIVKSDGDIRHAIHMLQLLANRRRDHTQSKSTATPSSSRMHTTKKAKASLPATTTNGTEPDILPIDRDPFFSDFHIVGKLLHAKKAKPANGTEAAENSSSNNVDTIMEASTMSLERVLELVHENFVEYFSEVDDLSAALELMSVTESILSNSYKGSSCPSEVFQRLRGVAQAILMRTIAVTNEHPTPSAFRPISGPRGFATRQKIAWKKENLQQLMMTHGTSSSNGRSDDALLLRLDSSNDYQYVCRGDTFAHDVEPFLGVLLGQRTQQNTSGAAHAAGQEATTAVEEVDDEIESSDDGTWCGFHSQRDSYADELEKWAQGTCVKVSLCSLII